MAHKRWYYSVYVPFYVFNFFIIGYVRIALLPLHGHKRGVWREGWLTNGGTEAGTAEAPVGRRPNGGRPFYGPLPFKTGRARPPPPFRSHVREWSSQCPSSRPGFRTVTDQPTVHRATFRRGPCRVLLLHSPLLHLQYIQLMPDTALIVSFSE